MNILIEWIDGRKVARMHSGEVLQCYRHPVRLALKDHQRMLQMVAEANSAVVSLRRGRNQQPDGGSSAGAVVYTLC